LGKVTNVNIQLSLRGAINEGSAVDSPESKNNTQKPTAESQTAPMSSTKVTDQDPNSQVVGLSYDLLDSIYQNSSAPHVHHGLWLSRHETREQAKDNLSTWLAERLALKSGENCVDIGSGYGQMARQLANAIGVRVTAITNSAIQHSRALQVKNVTAVEYRLGDWCTNDLPTGEADAAWAVESLEHMAHLDEATYQCRRVLKTGGRLIVLSWVAGEGPARWRRRVLLDGIVKDAALAPLRTQSQTIKSLSLAGFDNIETLDLSEKVCRTWLPTIKGVFGRSGLITDETLEPGLSWRTLRIALAYKVGALRYCAITAVAAQQDPSR
jgi:tocopherol O-methyltransferase